MYLWLDIIDKRLPAHIGRTFAYDLDNMSLKDIQPRIAQNLDSILAELNASEDIQIHYTRSTPGRTPGRGQNNRYRGRPTPAPRPAPRKICVLCKVSGRPHTGHEAKDCWFSSHSEKRELIRALLVDVDAEQEEEEEEETISYVSSSVDAVPPTAHAQDLQLSSTVALPTIRKVQTSPSPFFYIFHNHVACKVIIDTGATSSMISISFMRKANIPIKPTKHAAKGVCKTPIELQGEVHLTLHFNGLELPITALVVANLDCDILCGTPFCEDNDVEVHLKAREFSIHQERFSYGVGSEQVHNILRVDSLLLRNDSPRTILPGDFIEVESNQLSEYEGEVFIEPHRSAPKDWPQPAISRVVQGKARLPNLTNEPIYLHRSQHIANIRRVLHHPAALPLTKMGPVPPPPAAPKNVLCSSRIDLDPDSQLSAQERSAFMELHKKYDEVFSSVIPIYNDRFGAVRAHVTIGSVPPPPHKGKLPFYDQAKLRILQEEADKMESRGWLCRPEDINVEVLHSSPSFLLKKPDDSYRFVTAFTELGQYTRITPTASKSCNDVLRNMASFSFIIKCDMTKSFYQIRVSKKSIPYLGTVTPFKGLRVYLVSAMGQPGSSEALEELVSRVFGDFIQEGWFIHIHDDINVCANTIKQLILNWSLVLQRFFEADLRLSAPKTIIVPKKTIILGWVWNTGTLSCSPHKLTPLATIEPPQTATSMRAFLGAFRALSRCIPRYASLASPLEDSIKGIQGSQKITWTPDLQKSFQSLQTALGAPQTLTIPCPSDQLVMTVDASPLNKGLSATLFIIRNGKRRLADNFSMKLKGHQLDWMPCEHEALAIATGISHFAPYIRESQHKMQVLTDSRPCVQAYQKLCKGQFSASSRVSTFLSTLSTNNVSVQHISGEKNTTSDFGSRHPQSCPDQSCQICTFVNDMSESVVSSVSTSDVLSGTAKMPYLNATAWKSVQHDCQTLRRTHAHLTQGTRPTKKVKDMRDLRRFLQVASVDNNGLLVVKKSDPFVAQRNLIVVPSAILPGLVTAMHLYFDHATKFQLSKVMSRYFFGISSENVIQNVVDACDTCTSLKKLPKELFTQSSTPSPEQPGSLYNADILRLNRQKIFVAVDCFSSFTTAAHIKDESHPTLRSALLANTSLFRSKSCSVRVDNASGFKALLGDDTLLSHGMTLDFGRTKNPNKTAVADKCAQELELELLKRNPAGGPCSPEELQEAVLTLNSRIRNRGLSAKEILLQRDQHTGEQLNFDARELIDQQMLLRSKNNIASAASKSKGGKPANACDVAIGKLVYLKCEGDKTKGRERYIVTGITGNNVLLQKISGRLFSAKKYEVPITHIIPITTPHATVKNSSRDTNITHSDSDSDDYVPQEQDIHDAAINEPDNEDLSDEDLQFHDASADLEQPEDQVAGLDDAAAVTQRPQRARRRPDWYGVDVDADVDSDVDSS